MAKKAIALYVRVSTSKQDLKSQEAISNGPRFRANAIRGAGEYGSVDRQIGLKGSRQASGAVSAIRSALRLFLGVETILAAARVRLPTVAARLT